MTDTALTRLHLDSVKRQTSEQLQVQRVTAVVLALGSNYRAEHYLSRARLQLAALGVMQLSGAFTNPDFTATATQPKPDYTNQCVYLSLTSPTTWQELQQLFKQFEHNCDRQRHGKKMASEQVTISPVTINSVTMDIDILLLKLEDSGDWTVIEDRYPFKSHERVGVGFLLGNVN